MLRNYLKSAIRTLGRSPSNLFINVSGLALGITCVLLIFSIVSYHLSFDNFHQHGDRIYRFVTEQHRDNIDHAPAVPPAFVTAFRNDYTFGEKAARICVLADRLITVEEGDETKKFSEQVCFAEPEFFDIFNFPMVSGSSAKILAEPNTAIISARIAEKYFGKQSPMGKTIRFNNHIDFKVAGVLRNLTQNSDLASEIYFSYASIGQYNPWYVADDAWGGITSDIQSFVRLQPGVTPGEVEAVLPNYVRKYRAESKNVHHYKLQPLDDIHFNVQYGGRMPKTGLWILSAIGFFLMLTACLNFINLATAQAATRAREVGVRKTLGSARSQLFWQFNLETGVIVVLAAIMGLAAAWAVLPYLNQLLGTEISLDFFSDPRVAIFTAALIVVVTFASACYPGLILSRFRPVVALKGNFSAPGARNISLRRVLITFQFVISQILLIALIVLMYQTDYVRQTDPGFDQEGIVMIPVGSRDEKMNLLKKRFKEIPGVENVSLCFAAPASYNHWGTMFKFDKRVEAENFSVSFRGADENYLSTFDINLVAGRNLTPSDTVREFLVNEKLVEGLRLSSPQEILGRELSFMNGEWTGPVVGVVKDFHDQSLKAPISPIFISTSLEHYYSYAVKINMRDARTTLGTIEKLWSEMYPEQMYEYAFLDDEIANFYTAEQTMLKLIKGFSFIALFIGCMGLYGLVSFMAVHKTKEIGIRKVLGGSIAHILWIFGKEFTRLVLIAFVLAAPVASWLMMRWLETYTYRIDITAWIFMLDLVFVAVIVLLTVGYQSLKSALMNPVNSLRAE